jgi:hypothetical protein
VRTQLTLLPNYRFGSYLLYSVGGQLTYFVAVYTNPGTTGVVTQLPFMTAVNPSSGIVGVGLNAVAAFENLGAGNSTTAPSRDALVHQIDALVSSRGYSLVNATSVNPTVYVNVGSASFSAAGANTTIIAQIVSLLQAYGPGSVDHTVYAWTESSGNLNFGVLSVPTQGVTYLHYVAIKP